MVASPSPSGPSSPPVADARASPATLSSLFLIFLAVVDEESWWGGVKSARLLLRRSATCHRRVPALLRRSAGRRDRGGTRRVQ